MITITEPGVDLLSSAESSDHFTFQEKNGPVAINFTLNYKHMLIKNKLITALSENN